MEQEKKKVNFKIIIPIVIAIVVIAIVVTVIIIGKQKTNETSTEEQGTEKMLSQAEDVNWTKLKEEYSENKAKFEIDYMGKIFKYTGEVREIQTSYCILKQDNGKVYYSGGTPYVQFENETKVILPKEELAELKTGKKITVTGKLTKVEYPAKFVLDKAHIINTDN